MQRSAPSIQRSCVRHARQGDAVKTILITLGIIGLIMFLACAGIGVAGYLYVKRAIDNLEVTDPVKIAQATSDMVDITIPPEFKPKVAHSIFGISTVQYDWCPTGSCPPINESKLTMSSFGGNDPDLDSDSDLEDEFNVRFKEFKREDRELDIRGQKVKFAFVLGEEHADGSFDGELTQDGTVAPKTAPPTQPTADPTITPDSANDANQEPKSEQPASTPTDGQPEQPAGDKKPGAKRWLVHGHLQGKKGKCTIEIDLAPEQFNDELIMTMLKSIR